MKIFYAVQATGNGHISRAMELLPHLEKYGDVDIFLSGNNCHLSLDAPVKYRSRGLSLYYNCRGGLDFWQFAKYFEPRRLRQEVKDLPVSQYDLVINDFDYITAAACARIGKPSVNFGHQASFLSTSTPRPSARSRTGEWVLKNYAKATRYVGLHFDHYDDFIFTPVIKREIREAEPTDRGYVTVYLPGYCEPQLLEIFERFSDVQFEIFSFQTKSPRRVDNIRLLPVDKRMFNESLIHCTGIITGGGFETPAEALHLGKKIITIPLRSQYEQQCNAAALEKMGVLKLSTIDTRFESHLYEWLNSGVRIRKDYSRTIPQCLDYLFERSLSATTPEFPSTNFN